MNLFYEKLPIGKIGETAVKDYYNRIGVEVIDVSDDIEYQKKDIDILLNGQTVEIKTGTKIPQYQELCIELVSNETPEYYKKGWFYTTEAEVLIYYSPKEKKMYQILTEDLRNYYEENKSRIKTKRIYENEFGSIQKPALVAFVPICDIEKNIRNYRTITIE